MIRLVSNLDISKNRDKKKKKKNLTFAVFCSFSPLDCVGEGSSSNFSVSIGAGKAQLCSRIVYNDSKTGTYLTFEHTCGVQGYILNFSQEVVVAATLVLQNTLLGLIDFSVGCVFSPALYLTWAFTVTISPHHLERSDSYRLRFFLKFFFKFLMNLENRKNTQCCPKTKGEKIYIIDNYVRIVLVLPTYN